MPLPRDTALVLAVLVVATLPATTAGGGSGLGVTSVAAVAPAGEGGWWVLERSLDGRGGVVYRYTEGWQPADERHRIGIGNRRWFSPTDVARATDGGWWIVDRSGRVHRFAANWTYAGESHQLSSPADGYNATEAYDLERAGDGGWWVAVERDLARYGRGWTPADGGIIRLRGASSGYPVATARAGDSLWVLEGYTGRGAARYPLADDGRLARPEPTAGYGLPPVVDYPVDLVRTDGGWWIVDADGQVHRFDPYWRYAGTTYRVGSPDAVGSYPPDFINPLVVLAPVVEALVWITPGLVTALGVGFQYRRRRRRSVLLGGGAATLFIYGVVWPPFFARPIAFLHPHLPLLALVATWCVVGADAYTAVRSRTGIAPLLVGYLPVTVATVAFLGPAMRPL